MLCRRGRERRWGWEEIDKIDDSREGALKCAIECTDPKRERRGERKEERRGEGRMIEDAHHVEPVPRVLEEGSEEGGGHVKEQLEGEDDGEEEVDAGEHAVLVVRHCSGKLSLVQLLNVTRM
jgi:hypothetical protein